MVDTIVAEETETPKVEETIEEMIARHGMTKDAARAGWFKNGFGFTVALIESLCDSDHPVTSRVLGDSDPRPYQAHTLNAHFDNDPTQAKVVLEATWFDGVRVFRLGSIILNAEGNEEFIPHCAAHIHEVDVSKAGAESATWISRLGSSYYTIVLKNGPDKAEYDWRVAIHTVPSLVTD